MRIYKDDKSKTVFKIHYSHFEFKVMPFKLTNTLATFPEYINKILVDKFNVFVIVYLDDIFIYTKNKRKSYIKTI